MSSRSIHVECRIVTLRERTDDGRGCTHTEDVQSNGRTSVRVYKILLIRDGEQANKNLENIIIFKIHFMQID